MRGTVDVLARVVDGGVGADGAEQGVEGDGGFGVAFENVFEEEAEIAFAAVVKAGGEGVAVNGGFGDMIIELESCERFPVEESLLDVVAVLAAADGAFALVAFESGREIGGEAGIECGGRWAPTRRGCRWSWGGVRGGLREEGGVSGRGLRLGLGCESDWAGDAEFGVVHIFRPLRLLSLFSRDVIRDEYRKRYFESNCLEVQLSFFFGGYRYRWSGIVNLKLEISRKAETPGPRWADGC